MTPSRALDTMSRQQRDSVAAEAVAERVGPRVAVRAEMETYSATRRVRATFHVDDDAYVIVGHIGPDGVLRIVFPTDPHDDGFVQGGHSYQTAQFFAGYADEYQYRLRDVSFYRGAAAEHDSYDGGLGYVFVIASWRPMQVDQFSDAGRWDTFELTDLEYMRDPRPAVHELASLLVGDQPEAYTVKFASYFNTIANYSGSSFFNSAYGVMGCGIGSSFGYGFSDAIRPISWYLMSPYYMSQAYGYSNCYSPYGGYPYGYPTVRIAQNPPVPVRPSNPTQPRAFNPNDRHTKPEPRRPGGRMPLSTEPGNDAANGSHFSNEYRRRGLIAEDAPRTPPSRRRPGLEMQNAAGTAPSPTRPTIQQMVERRANDRHEGWSGANSGWSRAHSAGTGYDGTMRQAPATHPDNNPSVGNSRGYTSPFEHGANTGTRYHAPPSSGYEHSAPASHPAPVVSSPTPAASAPSSPAPSSSPPPASSSSGGRPGHPGH